MFTLFRTYFAFVLLFFLLYACSQTTVSPGFEFTAHHLKLQFDPDTQHLIAVDTISVTFSKNVDTIYFFLHDSLNVKRIGVAHQELNVQHISPHELKKMMNRLKGKGQWTNNTQIVKVKIPKSWYPDQIEVRYEGFVNSTLDSTLWCPALPDVMSSYFLTAAVPRQYRLLSNCTLRAEASGDVWRFCEWEQTERGDPITLDIKKVNS